jgi:hypothetical protein
MPHSLGRKNLPTSHPALSVLQCGMPRSCVVVEFDAALLRSVVDYGGSEAGTSIGGVEAPAKLF